MRDELSSESARAPDQSAKGSCASNRCILLIEDDPLVQAQLEVLLRSAGYAVDLAASLAAARHALSVRSYPIVMIDRVVSDGDCISICEELRREDGATRTFVIVLSMLDSTVEVGRGLRAGADVYLSKQTSAAEIVAYLDAAVSVSSFGRKK